MRLVCPNCGAQYEIDPRVMPLSGRDVQCSNCSHVWFQTHPDAVVAPPAAAAPVVPTPEPTPAPKPEPTPAPAPRPAPEPEPAPAPAHGAPKALDDEVRRILQEEAELELRARQAKQAALETQTDLGLDAAAEVSDEDLHRRVERARERAEEMQPTPSQDELKSRDVLPHIDEINSTLDAPEDDDDSPIANVQAVRRSGFRRGFILVVVLAWIVALIYVFAPQIAEQLPQLKPFIDRFVELVNVGRIWLDEALRGATAKIQAMLDSPDSV